MSDEKLLAYLKRVAGDLAKAREQLQEKEAAESEPIAIVSMGCRFGGGVRSPEDLWDLVVEGRDAVGGFPTDRGWEGSLLDSGGSDVKGSHTQQGAFIYDAGEFDPAFFGISPREALAMDPQQRLILEVAWEAIERGGIDPFSLRGTKAGLFVGATSFGYGGDYLGAPEELGGHLITGNVTSVLSGRVNYTLGLEGPSMTFDTACSSSLVAMHLAAQALRRGECSMALAGGAAIMSTPGVFVEFSRQRGLAADGRCKSFAEAADGTGWGEGVGLILLEKLSDARRHGHPVLAVLRGSAWNQDGASNGLTAPNGRAQQRVIKQALANAGLKSEDVDVVEAHGTGTTLGDPIEANALINTYGKERPANRPLWLGSLKSNIAHTQAAAGSGSVIKMVMALQNGLLPKTLHVDAPSSEINWSAGAVALLTEQVPWMAGERVRRAGVSAFGVSGTNAHLILEEAPVLDEPTERVIEAPSVMPWVVAGRGADALKAQAARLKSFVDNQEPVDLAYSLAATRSAFESRAVVLAGDNSAFKQALGAIASGTAADDVILGEVSGDPRPVFVFPGQGSQWVGMAVELIDATPVFSKRIKECDEALSEFVDFSVIDVLRGKPGTPPADRVDVIQPMLWAVMVSLAELWRSFGVEPAAVIGHSQGEIAAAAVSGALSLSDAARVCALRSRSLIALSGRGGMLSLSMPLADASQLISAWGEKVSVAAVNGPSSVVVSGEPQALAEVQQAAEAQEVRARMIDVDYASHSAQVEELRTELLRVLAPIKPRSSDISFISTVTGEPIDTVKLDAEYWVTNLRQTVLLETATRAALQRRHRLFVEASPHPVLAMALQSTAESASCEAVVVGSLRRNEGGPARFLRSVAEAYVNGAPVTWTSAFAGLPARKIPLPTYAFQRQRFWYNPPTVSAISPVETRFWDAVDSEDLTSVAATLGVGETARLSEVMTSLSSWRRRSLEVSAVDTWCYEIGWRSVASANDAVALGGEWLVVVPASGAESVKGILGLLTAAGAEVTRIDVDPSVVADRAALAERIRDANPYFDGVLSLLALDDSAHTAGLTATVTLAQALGDAEIDAPLWCVTQSAVALNAAEPLANPGQAMVWGLTGSYGAERPQRWGGLVDLPEQIDERSLSRLVAALGSSEPGEQYAVRQSGVFARRLVRAMPRRSSREWKPSGTVVITGGLGGLGSHLATWLAGTGDVAHLLLLGRRGPDTPGADKLRAELDKLGVGVTIVACDAADRTQLEAALKQAPAEHPITAVVHAAGVLDDSPVDSLTPQRLDAVVRNKATAAHNLHELTASMDLSAFVMFSAVAGTIGVAGQGNYAAANAYLDALAQHRRSQGLPATTVAWSAWEESGMVDAATAEVLKGRGIPAMSRGLATAALQRALDVDETFLMVAEIAWDRFLDSGAVLSTPLLSDIAEVAEALKAEKSTEDTTSDSLRAKLSTVDKVAGLRVLQDVVTAQAGNVLGYEGGSLPASRSFKELGVDSLTAVQLRNRLSEATGLRLPVTLAFDHPNAAALAEHLYEELAPSTSGMADLVREELDKLEATLTAVPADDADTRQEITARLRTLMWKWEGATSPTTTTEADELDAATDDEVFDLLDKELGFA